MRLPALVALLTAFFIPVFFSLSLAAEETPFQKAQWLYSHEDYEEALEILKSLRASEPNSSEVAYYLGLTYKKMQDYPNASPHLEAAVILEPPMKGALPELIEVLYQTEYLDAAAVRIAQAERAGVAPARVAFYKGLVLLKQKTDPEGAVKAFDQAERLDPQMADAARYQKGLARLQMKDYAGAESIFRDITVKDPSSGLAAYANEYADALGRRREQMRPLRGSLGYSIQYDDNVIFKPLDELLGTSITNKDDLVHVLTGDISYNWKPCESFSLRSGYNLYASHHDDLGFYDTVSHTFPLQPTFYFDKASVAFPMSYTYATVDDRQYLGVASFSNQNMFAYAKDRLFQFQTTLNLRDYESWAATRSDESRDGEEYIASGSWFFFFGPKDETLLNFRYAASYDDTDGANWRHMGNRLTLTAVVPVPQVKNLTWNFSADYFRRDFINHNSTYDKNRHDNIVTVQNLLSYEFYKNVELQLQYTYVAGGSSIGVYDYSKNVYSVGVRCRF